jgi:hypothetical protein
VGKRSLLVVLASVLAMLALPAAAALAAPAAPAQGSAAGGSPPSVVVSLGNGQKLTIGTSGATCHGTSCAVTERVPLGDLPAAAQSERAADMQALAPAQAPAQAPDAVAAIPAAGPARCHFTDAEAFAKSATANPDRVTSCADGVFAAVNYETTTTAPFFEVTGFFFWEDQQWEIYRTTRGNWTHGLVVLGYRLGASGTLDGGVTADLGSNCDIFAGVCSATSAAVPDPQLVAITPGSRHAFEWTESDAGASSTTRGAVNVLNPDLGVTWTDISTTPAKSATDIGQLHGRCDRIITTTDGCVNEAFTPTVTYSAVKTPKVAPVAQHIFNAQHTLSIAWGVPASARANGRVLTRDTSAADQRANNRAACRTVRLAAGQNCDEFPLATTFQGASFQPVFSAVAVAAAANSSQGGTTRGFYAGNRLINHDPFYVLAILANGSRSW